MSFSDDDENMEPKYLIKSDSDIGSDDEYDENDYFNDNDKEYKETQPTPQIDPPKSNIDINKKFNENKFINKRNINETFMNFDEKFQKIKNEESLDEEFPDENADEICINYKNTYNDKIDYSLNSYDMYSKNHLRNTLVEQITNLDWKNKEKEINEAKKETNAYEDIHEKFFNKKQSYQLGNINYLFQKELIKIDNIFDDFPALIVGDNGGFTDYILYYTIYKGGYNPTLFVIPERDNAIKDMEYRKEIKEKVDEHVNILYDFFEENKDIDDNPKLSIDFLNNITKKISEKTEGYMVNLYIARKVIPFSPDYSQEIRYKKFLLINTLLAFKCLNNGGNFIIKLYDTFTPFTISLIYIIFKNFECVSIFKPVSTRQYSSSRFLVAEKYLKDNNESTTHSIKYLEEFLTKYIELTKNDYDVKYLLRQSELRKNENFLKIIPEINNGITEKRIDSLKEIINHINGKKTKLYDKMAIKKFFLDNWGIPVINYDESLLLKNQKYNPKDRFGKDNYQPKKIYTTNELLDMYGDIGVLNDDQKKLIAMMSSGGKKKHKKVVHKEKERVKTLDEKYQILELKFGNKKNYSNRNKDQKMTNKKRERNDNNNKKDNKEKEKYKKEKKEDKKIDKNEIKNDKDKKEIKDNDDEFDSDEEELFGINPESKKKKNIQKTK